MLSLVVIDDEYLLRLGIPQIIDWNALGITIIGEASNGEDGLALVKSLRPDIVLLDIQMPIMNGLSMMEAMKKEAIPSKIVVLSGYNDFEYAQIAMQNGAVDYLLKPVTQENLISSMQRVKAMIAAEQETSQYRARLDQEISSIQQQFLRRLVLGEIANLPDVKKKIEMLKLPLELQDQVVIRICLDQRFVFQKLYSPEKIQEYWNTYEQGIKQCLLETGIFTGFSIPIDTGIQCLLLHPVDSQMHPDTILGTVYDCCNNFLLFMKSFSQVSFSIGISDICRNFHDISAAYQAADSYSRQKFLPGCSSIASRVRNPFEEYPAEIQKTIQYIKANYFLDITVGSAAKALYISPSHLMHLLKKELGLTFNTCVTMIRISAAQKILASGHNSLSDTAQIVGYRDVKHFSQLFTNLVGVSPSVYCTLIQKADAGDDSF